MSPTEGSVRIADDRLLTPRSSMSEALIRSIESGVSAIGAEDIIVRLPLPSLSVARCPSTTTVGSTAAGDASLTESVVDDAGGAAGKLTWAKSGAAGQNRLVQSMAATKLAGRAAARHLCRNRAAQA
ncbi:hypothetical protein SBBP2_590002 [Burkholderiales bacterium]|nr:hypothetical protein SBBP2_590002 [Burkholderiales bacterium]